MRQWTVDAFAAGPFKGNPACVVEPFAAWPDAGWMQALAMENNQAETAFLLKTDDPARFGLRWFTPTVEVPLCGHATLASGHVLAAELGLDVPAVTFDTRSGPLVVSRQGEGYQMDFPADPTRQIAVPAGMAEVLGAEVLELWVGRMMAAVLADEATVRGLQPDIPRLETVATEAGDDRGNLIVCATADPGGSCDVISRFFAPGSGINEDPATGSAHCLLSPLFSQKLGRARLKFHQAYPGRGGDIEAEHLGDRVLLSGRAVTVLDGRLRL